MDFFTPVSVLVLLISGIYFSFYTKLFQFRTKVICRNTVGYLIKKRELSGFKAMSLALGSTIGIGNIIGVTAAIIIGGPGAVLWMLFTGFLGMILKFVEVNLCVTESIFSKRKNGGPMYLLSNCKSIFLKKLGILFAVICVLASIFAGNLMQSKSIYRFMDIGFDVGFVPVTVILLPMFAIILSGNDKLYQNLSSILVPLMALLYVISMFIILLQNSNYLSLAITLIFKSAFGFKEIGGGFSGAVISLAIKQGVMKGLFTHEAGMGSSPIAHCSSDNKDPLRQGCWGIIEVFIDTVVVCMLTALAVISSPLYLSDAFTDPFQLICGIYKSAFGSFGLKSLSISVVCFAFASIIGWSYYGIKSLDFLTEKSFCKKIYISVFIFCIPLSCFLDESFVWFMTDLFNSMMLLPNITTMFIFRKSLVIKTAT
ncbi:MAG: sodium:alanine symporter family protein [Clostridia bacterium]|nr:sodium:alanine symporter family protein [Clostridia bacterium]